MIFYVRNLPENTTEAQIEHLFEALGTVSSVSMLSHARTGRSLGVAVVDLPNLHEQHRSLSTLTGVQIDGRDINIGPPRAAVDRRTGNDRRAERRDSRERRDSQRRVVLLSDYR